MAIEMVPEARHDMVLVVHRGDLHGGRNLSTRCRVARLRREHQVRRRRWGRASEGRRAAAGTAEKLVEVTADREQGQQENR